MTWSICKIEDLAKKHIVKDFGHTKGDELFGIYSNARNILLSNVLPYIQGKQPYLTEHGPDHISNVLNNANDLLGDAIKKLSGAELYCLIMSILFHDVGNFFDRRNHQHHITQIYDFVRTGPSATYNEKYIILKLVGAHCGIAADGSRDTIHTICETAPFEGKPVDLGLIGSILRFADELAEGVQRTSLFMHEIHSYPLESELFHEYSKITEVNIDRGGNRIALTYNIPIKTESRKLLSEDRKNKISELIDFTYKRIIKLNQERQYAKYYCKYLSTFLKTTVSFNYWINEIPQDFGLNQLILSDLVVPGDLQKEIKDYDPSYDKTEIINAIFKALNEMRD
jgi:hypothetical protein